MHRYLIQIALSLLTTSLAAQIYPLRDKLDNVFAHIDKSQVPTGFLSEFGASLVPPKAFRGELTDSNKIDIRTWRFIYATIQTSRIYGTNPLPSLATVNTAINTVEGANHGALPIPLLYAEYNYLRPDATTMNLLSAQNNQLFDVPGRSQSPYSSAIVFAAAPSLWFATTGSPSVIFKEELFFKSTNKTLSQIQIDFNDGRGYLNVAWNLPVAAQYLTKGIKQIKVKLSFADSSIAQCYSFIEILEIQNGQARYSTQANDTIPFQPDSIQSGGKAYVKYSTTNTTSPKKLKKPLVVVEGYDINSIAPKLKKNFSFEDFIVMLNNVSGYDMNYQLDNLASYDLVFLDYNNGTDDIRRNAALVKEVINWVNNQKSNVPGNQPNVVLGISMGGLIARYALADMTKQNQNTQTRLLITHDSPHRGANTPLGLQALTKAFDESDILPWLSVTDLIPEAQQAANVLNEPATQQLLIVRALSGSGGYATNTFLEDIYRPMVTFGTGGPQPTYSTIAVSLGAECGAPVLDPSTQLIHANGNVFLGPILFGVGFDAEVIVNSLPNPGVSALLSRFRFSIDSEILFIPIEVDVVNKSYFSPPSLIPWDGVPGGTYNLRDQVSFRVPNSTIALLPFFYFHSGSNFYNGDFCFVPTVSALDVTTINQTTVYSPYSGGVSVTNVARVNNFIAQARKGTSNIYNEPHPRFNARNAEWIYREMENPVNNTINCSELCHPDYGASISPPYFLCYNAPQNVVLNGTFPPGASITWSVSPAAYFSNSSGTGKTATLNIVNSSYAGPVQIGYQVLGLCQPLSISTNIWVGPPAGQINGPTEVYPDQVYMYEAGPNGNPFGFQWTISGSGFNWGYSDTQPTVQVYWSGSGTEGYVHLHSTNGCGSTDSTLPVTITIEGGCNPCQIVVPFPNPAKEEMTVSIQDLSQTKEFHGPYQIFMHDLSGVTVVKAITEKQVIPIDIRSVKPGLYFLRVINPKGISASRQVQVVN